MPNYRDYTVEELAQDDFFQRSVRQPTAETDLFWSDFLEHYPEKQAVVATARAFLQAVGNIQRFPTQEQGRQMWAGIQRQLQDIDTIEPASEPIQRPIGFRWGWAAAAAVLLLLGFGWWFIANTLSSDRSVVQHGWSFATNEPLVEQTNETGSPLSVRLIDGSRVVLQPHSRLRHPKTFDSAKREVHLEGEGFFEVTHNTQQPFLVYAGKVVTQVVGTSFTIKALPKNPTLSVAVRTGKVAVFTLKAMLEAAKNHGKIANRLLLTSNQQAIFDTRSEQLTKRLVDNPTLIQQPSTNQYFVFENAPVNQVFHKLEQAYGVTIQYDTTTFSHCNLTAPLGNEPLFRKLDIICQTIGATYEVWGTRIIVSGPGCPAP
ncbi:FecR family protein [Spirosoma panaciterrae]|uniref:FecR family protein n=1 Tax=Spirosoma panaciterrae TaxID=496058 RepID=UPI00037046E5|nr:FecR family protein [Spirosoma panaciterrae]